MSIIRSNIARQLLAEGGAPRKPFANGGFDYESAAAFGNDMGMTSSPGSGEESGGDLDEGFVARDAFFTPTKSRFQTIKDDLTDRFITNPRMNRIGRGLLTTPGAIKSAVGLRDVPPELLATLAEDYTGVIGDQARNQKGLFSEGMVGSDISLENAASTLEGLEDLGVDLTGDIRSQVGDLSNTAFASRFGPKTKGGEGGDNEPIKKLIQPTIKKEEPREGTFDDILKFYGARFEDGGDVRQEYGLGSIVKKIGRTVKKVAKSPIGKVALLAGLNYAPALFGKQTVLQGLGKNKMFADLFLKDAAEGFALSNIKPFAGITAASLLAGSLAKEDEEDEKLPTVANTDPEMTKFLEFYGGPRRFAAEGGMMEQDEMLDLGGKEMDLRGGGFVPLGEYEKKDDVPARLSKNEFVFTADAVTAAGGGSVDRGADIMYKTMKNLENKVA